MTNHFGSDATNYVQTFNFQSGRGVGKHLANQHQQICIRREAGNCKICYSVDTRTTDIVVTGKTTGKAGISGTMCCGYGLDGAGGDTGGGDCIIIPGAQLAAGIAAAAETFCGSMMGLAVIAGATADANSITICSQQVPFRIEFNSDTWEKGTGAAANQETEAGNPGFKIRYYQTTC